MEHTAAPPSITPRIPCPALTLDIGADTCKAFAGSASTTFTNHTGEIVGKATAEDVRFEYDDEYEQLPGSDYWTAAGIVNWTYEGTNGNCTISGSGSFTVDDGEGSIHITDPDQDGHQLYYAAGGPPPDHPPYTATMTCPDTEPFEINPQFNWIWLNASVLNLHTVADDGHLRGTEEVDWGGGDIQTWEWDLAPAP